ncbi:MAG: nicotinate (nicotinamide) nucleotide adenylyltransferase [Saccharofermentanales bacterium]
MRIGIFGGTFDPIHKGHLAILDAAASGGFFERIYVVPSAIPPHKPINSISMSTYRYEMARIAVKNMNFDIPVILSDIEICRNRVSYTLDTVREISRHFNSKASIFLICGSDVLFDIQKWHRPDELLHETGLYLALRPGYNGHTLYDHIEDIRNRYSTRIELFSADLIDISSMQLRERLFSGDASADPFIDPGVLRWIRKNQLYDPAYDFQNDIQPATMQKLADYEFRLRSLISSQRLVHSLNTMKECIRLSKLFDTSPDKCAIAGLLHDCTKHSKSGMYTVEDLALTDISYNDIIGIPAEIEHAYTGSVYAQRNFDIVDEDILNAIRYHTTSRLDASQMEKIVFIADKIEPGRTFHRIDEIRQISYRNLDDGLLECLRDIMLHLEKTGKTVHPDTIATFNSLQTGRLKGSAGPIAADGERLTGL